MAARDKSKRLSVPRNRGTGLGAGGPRSFKDQLLCDLELQQTRLTKEVRRLESVQAELAASRNNFVTLYHQAPISYITFDPHGRILDANATAVNVLGFERERLLHLPFTFLVISEDVHKFLTHLRRCQNGGEGKIITELRLKTRNNASVRNQLVSVAFMSGGQQMFLTALVDLTERSRNEDALAEAKEFAENIVETVREPLIVLDCDLRVISVNRAFTQFFKKPAELAKGRSFEVLLNLWWSGNELRHKLERVLVRNEALEDFQIETEPPGLGRRVLLLNARCFLQKNNSRPYLLVAIEDITARKSAEEQLRKINEELEGRVEARTDALQKSYEQMEAFCYSIAHDLRAPLRSMKGFSYLLAEQFGAQMGPEGRDYTQRIQRSAERMDQLISDLLNYGRLNTVNLQLERINLEDLFNEIQGQFEKELADKKARIVKQNPLPAVTGHRVVLQVAFTNLISNALKFVPPRVRPRVTVWAENKGPRVRIWIKDNGIGIARENQAQIFGVFQRLHTADRYPGTGIGLALVSKGIERIGGHVGVKSDVGKGSQFWIELEKREKEGS